MSQKVVFNKDKKTGQTRARSPVIMPQKHIDPIRRKITSVIEKSALKQKMEQEPQSVFKSDIIKEQEPYEEEEEEEVKVYYKDVDHVQFNFFSEEEIEEYCVVEIKETKLGGPNSLYDLRMGPLDNNEICETCDNNCKDCPGHFGFIKLNAKIPHPLRSKTIIEYLNIFCNKCHRLMMTKEKIFLLNFNKYRGENKYKAIYNFIANNVKVCPYCETVPPIYSCQDDKYMMEVRDSKIPLRYDDIYDIFSNIRPDDINLLGFDSEIIHPIRLMITNLLVVPPCVRPFVKSDDGENMHDDLTYKYIDILKTNKKIENESKEKTRLDEIDRLMFHIKTLMDNNKGKARDTQGKRALKCFKKRISGKQGRIRQNIQGKRSEFCGRTVIGPEVYCKVEELVVPEEMAKTLTYPIRVNSLNMEKCKKLLDDGKVNFIIRDEVIKSAKVVLWTQGFKLEPGDVVFRGAMKFEVPQIDIPGKKIVLQQGDAVYRNGKLVPNAYEKQPRRKHVELKEGDIIERQLQNGDLCVFNRQPTLWKGSMRAKRIKILPGKTLRFSLASTASFNADFDGDIN